jgi:hypothetical protein
MGAFVKRSKRAIHNVDRNCLQPLIRKAMWRYMQFDGERYPSDVKFVVKATMGIVAREVEAMQLTQLMGMMPEGMQGVSMTIVQGIIENSSVGNKDDIVAAVQQALQPPPPEEAQRQKELEDMQFEQAKATAQQTLLENQKIISEIKKNLADVELKGRTADVADDKQRQGESKLQIENGKLDALLQQNQINQQRLALTDRQLDIKEKEVEQKKGSNTP